MENVQRNHRLTFRTPEEMDRLRPFGVICMVEVTEAQRAWAAENGVEIATDYEGLRFSKSGHSVKVRPRTDGDVNIEVHSESEWSQAQACYLFRRTFHTGTLSEALRALAAR